MPVLDAPSFKAALPPRGPLLGIDPGSKRLGVAVSDPERVLAGPLEQIVRTRFAADAARILSLYAERACVGVVIGMPLNMDGSAGPAAQAARAFARNLLALGDRAVLLWDERLTTAAVTRTLIAADTSRARRLQVTDKLAAAYLLQGALDRLRI